jgi:hypothetical protein
VRNAQGRNSLPLPSSTERESRTPSPAWQGIPHEGALCVGGSVGIREELAQQREKFVSLRKLLEQISDSDGATLKEVATWFEWKLSRPERLRWCELDPDVGPRHADERDIITARQALNRVSRSGKLTKLNKSDDAPHDCERFGFMAAEIYPFIERCGVALARPDGSEAPAQPDQQDISNFFADSDHASSELRDCMTIWRAAVRRWELDRTRTPKSVVEDVIDEFHENIGPDLRNRYSTVCNWDKSRGRRKIVK